jgi:hypothetical protein
MTLPPAPYPTTHAERVKWLERGTPPQWHPYVSEHPDALRDGLLRGFWAHRRVSE